MKMGELFAEIGHEIGADPAKFIIELVQFALLLGIIWVIAVGVGKYKGTLTGILAKRKSTIESRMQRADGAQEALATAQERAATIIESARTEAASILREARKTAQQESASAHEKADAEAARVSAHAKEVLDSEFAEMRLEIRDQLVDLVAGATRSILNEGLSAQEQRELIQDAVSAGVDRIEKSDGRTRARLLAREVTR